MRNQWRWLLLLRCHSRSRLLISTLPHSQVNSTRSISSWSLLSPPHPRRVTINQFHNPPMSLRFFSSSELAVEPTKDQPDQNQIAVLTDIFSRTQMSNEKIKLQLESNNIVITHDLVLNALKNLQSAPDVARRFFKWVSKSDNEKRLSSKSYNLMLGVLLGNGFVKEFWDMVGTMKKKGYGVSKGTFVKALEKFEKDGMSDDVKKLKDLYASGSTDNSVENLCSRVCRAIRSELWGDNVEKRLRGLNVEFSSELVSMVVDNLGIGANKGLIFFRWVEESGLCKHDERTYNAMVRALASEDASNKFWRVVDEMRNAGFEMYRDTYVDVLGRFVKKGMIKDAVDLYEFAMGGLNKPSVHDCTFLLRKIVVGKELDMNLLSRVVRIFREGGNVITNSAFDAVLKSLTSVARVGECNSIIKALEEGGFQLNGTLQRKIASQLSRGGKHDEAGEFMDNMEASDSTPDHKIWASLVEGYCLAGDLEKASDSFRKMVEKVDASSTGYALELLVSTYCRKNRAADSYKFVTEMIDGKDLQPWHSTYKILIGMLLAQGGFKEALDVLPLMKKQGYPPFLEPFIEYLSKCGSPDDAIAFSKAMTVKRYPSTSVFLQLFEAYFKVGRHNEAQDFLAKSPRYIRNHADVLNMFCSVKSGEKAPAITMAA
ncbi:pentatricopeptide repeat-containing protein At3g02490, mitochondrial-like [Coffea arabica]|uniref:Pentatricopeptide repeat-containing protein At3g02490, mitochondrial-like n=1 Tax=Coffea arabica TaxID=13443 RepID=A0A6P6TFW2_COFAR